MYRVLRALVRLGLWLFCGRIQVIKGQGFPVHGPVLLASNHPNSFLDALIIATQLPWPMHFLARGDAFRKPWAARLLGMLYMIPIYRMSEGRAELRRTERSLTNAHHLLASGRSVLVFSEGISRNGTELQPLGKGTARIAMRAWRNELAVPVMPVRLHYSSFHRPFPQVQLHTSVPMVQQDVPLADDAAFLHAFNALLRSRLLEIGASTVVRTRPGALTRVLLALPAFAGLLLHAPWYFGMRALAARWPKDPLFLDSVLFAWLLLTYPLWLLVLTGLGSTLGLGGWAWLVWIIAPITLMALRDWHVFARADLR